MKLLPTDPELLALAAEWEALSPEARDAFLRVKPGTGGIPARDLGPERAELEAAGMLVASARGATLTAPARFHDLLVFLRLLHRHAVLDLPLGALVPSEYLREHFSDEEVSWLYGRPPSYWTDRSNVAALVSTEQWVERFLALKDAKKAMEWARGHLPPGEPTRLDRADVLDALQKLIGALTLHPRGVPLAELDTLLPAADPGTRQTALEAGFRYVLILAGIRDGRIVIGLLPGIASALGPPPGPPEPVATEETFEGAYLLGDMTTVLVEAATDAIPVRGQDGALYVRSQRAIVPRMESLPAWVAEALDLADIEDEIDEEEERGGAGAVPVSAELAQRMAMAVGSLARMGFARMDSRAGRYSLSATDAGREWLALSDGERLRVLLQPPRESPQRVPQSWYDTDKEVDFFPMRVDVSMRGWGLDLRAPLTEAFLAIPAGEMVSLDDFLAYHARTANPFPTSAPKKRGAAAPVLARDRRESLWEGILHAFVLGRLGPFGGVKLGRMAGGGLAIALTGPGRYLLGADASFDYAPAAEGDVIVQPDFELVFLSPAPRLEAEVARFSERIGAGVGALFRITRASVLRAAEQGLAGDAMVATLERAARGGVPANVARQLHDWVAGTRRVQLRTAVLITCPDPETAGRVRALAGSAVDEITPTLLALTATGAARKALVKRLRERGIFVTETEPAG